MVFLIKAAQLILSLAILVTIHEFGHFIFARLFKTRVEKFRLFFDPWFTPWKKKIGETEYGIGWVPLGGYVKIAGMIDESMDKEQMNQPEQPWEFRAKPAWQRLLIMTGGVLFNLIFAVLIYISILWAWGEEYLPAENVKYGVHVSEISHEMGFNEGDIILKVNGEPVRDLRDARAKMLLDDVQTVTVSRGGQLVDVPFKSEYKALLLQSADEAPFTIRIPFVVEKVSPDKGAMKAGMKAGDRVIGVNNQEKMFFLDIAKELKANAGNDIDMLVVRNSDTLSLKVHVSDEGMIGVQRKMQSDFLDYETVNYSFFTSIGAGTKMGINQVKDYLKQLKILVNPENKGYKQLGSFGTIGSIFAPQWHWQSFWEITALISIILAVMNILPIPALDGGHVMFLLYEMITGRKPHEKAMEYAQIVGMVILLGLMVLALYNDVDKFLIK